MKRWLKRVGLGLYALVALVLWGVVAAVVFLHTERGGRVLRDQVVTRVNAALMGALEVERARLRGAALELEGVRLLDPEGEPVAEVERVRVALSPLDLFRRQVTLHQVLLERPSLHVVQDEEGTNLQRALEPRQPKPEEEEDRPLPVDVVVTGLRLEDGHLTFVSRTGEEPFELEVDDLDAGGELSLLERGERLEAALRLDGQLRAPAEGPLRLELTADGRGETTNARVDAELAGARLVARATIEGEQRTQASIERLELPPAFARAFVAGWPLRVALRGEGEVVREGARLTADLAFRAGSARLTADVAADPARAWAEKLQIEGESIDLSELVENGPASDVSFTLTARGGGRSLETLDGELTLKAPASQMAGDTFGPIELVARAKDGHLVLERMKAVMPGLALTARGASDGEQVRLYGRVAAKSLSRFSRTLGRIAGPEGLPLAGNGALAVRVEGPLEAPALQASGRFPFLRYGAQRASGVRLRARVGNLRAPLASDTRVQLSARGAQVGGRHLEAPRFSFQLRERRLSLAARSRGAVRLSLAAAGRVDDDARGLRLSSLSLRYPEARWRLQRPARLRFDDAVLAVEDLSLRAGEQRLWVDARREGRRLTAHARVENLALHRLPKDLVTMEAPLAGTLSAELRAEGRADAPAITVAGGLAGGRYGEVKDVDLSVEAKYADGRADGQVRATAVGARARLDFDLPLKALRTGAAAALSADLVVEDVSLAETARALGEDPRAEGRLSARAELRGTARAPRLDASVTVEALRAGEHPPVDATFSLKSAEGDRLHARLEATAGGEESFVALETPWTLARLLRRPPTVEQALRAPLVLTGELRSLPVPYDDPSNVPGDRPRHARLSGDLDLRGAALEPRGKVDLTLEDFGAADFWPLTAHATLNLARARQSFRAEMKQGERQLLLADARLDAPVGTLRRLRTLRNAPISVALEAGPVGLPELQALSAQRRVPGQPPPPQLRGLFRTKLRAEGTLEAPVVDADVSVHGLGTMESGSEGDLSVRFAHRDGRSRLAADLLSRGGELALRVAAPLSLALSSLQKQRDLGRLPLHASLTARDFDPSFLSRVSPQLLSVGGRIDAEVEAKGPLALPEVDGHLAWVDGWISLEGKGRYEDLRLRLRGTEQQVVVEEAFVRSGEGSAELTATFTRRGDAADLQATAQLRDFAIVSDFQRVATVSLRAEAEGSATVEKLTLSPLRIPEAQVMLPPGARRDLHPVEPPEGIAWYYEGEPLGGDSDEGKGGAGTEGSAGAAPVEPPLPGQGEGGGEGGPTVELLLDAPRNLWVRGDDLNVEVGFSEDFRILLADQPYLFGELLVRRGRVDVMGRRFDLSPDSTVAFTGPASTPRLDLTATHQNRREDVTVTMRVTGQGEDVALQPSSVPPLTETEIYTLIATGRRSLQPGGRSSGSGGAAVTVLGALATSQLQKGVRQVIPLDILSIEQGEEGVGTARVEAGTYLSDRLYLGIASEIGAQLEQGENRNELLLEYQLWRRWILELEYGDAREGGADLIWRKQY